MDINALKLKNKNLNKGDNSMKTVVQIDGMCCGHCANRVENALSAVSGVVSADVKLKKNIAVIRSREDVSDEEITNVVAEAVVEKRPEKVFLYISYGSSA